MIIVLAKAIPKEGMKSKIIEEAEDLIIATCAENGCIEYNLYTPADEENSLLFVEKWEGKEYLDSHMNQPHFVGFGASIEKYLAKDLEISVYSSEEMSL